MTDEIFRGMREFQQYAEKLQQLMTDMQDQVPRHATGEDAQGAVSVTLGPDRLPESIKVASDWQRRQPPENLGPAVVDAYGSAMSEQMEGWSRSLEQTGWEERATELDGMLEVPGSGTGPVTPPAEPSRQDLRHVRPRPMEDVVEDTLAALDALDGLDVDSFRAPEATGESAARRVTIGLSSHALVSCDVDPQWAAQQSSIRLSQALNEALSHARAKLADVQSPGAARIEHLNPQGLMNEFLAMLNDPQQLR
ncbi:hypothetical protein [Streptomyces sp. NBRC 110028]|uniref:hypothetical protein n=1 Tax=Streptomyces sp. NBRC 110028 TaxID=1621260 RepID=UPI000A63FEFF|nr:hypothetical protein [Streptomyces sp. NBRC 110028]